MNQDFENLAARAAPAIFVVLWSTGFIATKYVLHSAEPLTYLAIRMALVVGLMAVIVAIARPQWPDRSGLAHSAVAGILVHGFYLGGTAVAIAHSIPAGLSALIPGLQPILTSTIANRWLGERVTPVQWIGLLLGLAGVVLILHDRPISGEAGRGWLASGVSLVSITLGTLYQRRYCGRIDWRPAISCNTSRSRSSSRRGPFCSRTMRCTGPASLCWRWPGSRWCCRSDQSGCCIG
jgi:drug/metabolite transporter (DMT)-like permease